MSDEARKQPITISREMIVAISRPGDALGNQTIHLAATPAAAHPEYPVQGGRKARLPRSKAKPDQVSVAIERKRLNLRASGSSRSVDVSPRKKRLIYAFRNSQTRINRAADRVPHHSV